MTGGEKKERGTEGVRYNRRPRFFAALQNDGGGAGKRKDSTRPEILRGVYPERSVRAQNDITLLFALILRREKEVMEEDGLLGVVDFLKVKRAVIKPSRHIDGTGLGDNELLQPLAVAA
jgi:hypothetical protein